MRHDEQARTAAARLAGLTRPRHDAVVVLGSGWGPAADAFADGPGTVRLPMTALPGFLAPTAEGHPGEALSCDVGGVATLVLLGRTHLYEGHGPRPVVHGVRTAAAAGARLAVLTNANGSLRGDWQVGQAVLVADHLNLTADRRWRGRRSSISPTPGRRGCARWPAPRPGPWPRGSTPGCPAPTTRPGPRPPGCAASART